MKSLSQQQQAKLGALVLDLDGRAGDVRKSIADLNEVLAKYQVDIADAVQKHNRAAFGFLSDLAMDAEWYEGIAPRLA